MTKSTFTEEQPCAPCGRGTAAVRGAAACRSLVVSEARLNVWRKKYAKLDLTELRELRPLKLRDGNG